MPGVFNTVVNQAFHKALKPGLALCAFGLGLSGLFAVGWAQQPLFETGIEKKVQTENKPLSGKVLQRQPGLPPVQGRVQLDFEASGFYYQPEQSVYYREAVQAWLKSHPSGIPAAQTQAILARRAYQKALAGGQNSLLIKEWALGSQLTPWTLEPKVLLQNPSPTETLLDVPLTITLQARFSPAWVRPSTQVADSGYFTSQVGPWQTLWVRPYTVEVLPPSSQERIDLPPVQLLKWLQQKPYQLPERLRLQVRYTQTPGAAAQASQAPDFQQELQLQLGHAVLPLYLY